MKTQKTFLQACHFPELARAVIRQMGGWSEFKEHAEDVASHGIAGGFGGFIYYKETAAFYKKNRKLINAMAESLADDMGVDVFTMVRGFNCLYDVSVMDVAETMTGKNLDQYIANGLTWFAGEEVCRVYSDLLEC